MGATYDLAIIDAGEAGQVRATRVRPRQGRGGAHAIELSDGSVVDGHEVLLAIGRTAPLAKLDLETVGVTTEDGQLHLDERLRIADGVCVPGDPAGPEMYTHLAVYQGKMVARIALGEDVEPDNGPFHGPSTPIPRPPGSASSSTRLGSRLRCFRGDTGLLDHRPRLHR